MKSSDIYLVKGEAIEHERNGNGAFIVYARRYKASIYLGYESAHSQNAFDITEVENPSPALATFIEEAKAYFTPKRSCGELTFQDLCDLMTHFALSRPEAMQDEIAKEWALANNIQLPESKAPTIGAARKIYEGAVGK